MAQASETTAFIIIQKSQPACISWTGELVMQRSHYVHLHDVTVLQGRN
jgi:hypothetical protein